MSTRNALRGHLAEYGVTAPQGPAHVGRLARAVEDPDSGLPEPVRELGCLLLAQIAELAVKIAGLETDLDACARQDEEAARLMTILGIGPVTTTALQAFATPMEGFQRPRLRRLARPGAAPGHDRRQAETGKDIEDGPTRPQTAVDHGRHGRGPLGGSAWCDDRSLAR